MTLAEMRAVDSLGFPLYPLQSARAMVEMVKSRGLLDGGEPAPCDGTGIIIAGGGRYLSWAWTVAKRIRDLGSGLPIQVWHMGEAEMPRKARKLFEGLGAEPVDAFAVLRRVPLRYLDGWTLKCFSVMNCPWRKVVFIDADCYPARRVEDILVGVWDHLFFHDVKPCRETDWGYVHCGLKVPDAEWETGQFVVDKVKAWRALRWTSWLNEHPKVWFKLGHGDKFTFELGFRITETPVQMGDLPVWSGFGISHAHRGVACFEHKMATKRGEWAQEPWLAGLFEEWRGVYH